MASKQSVCLLNTIDAGEFSMALSEDSISSIAYYYCSIEWHLNQLRDSDGGKTPFVAILYPFAYRISKKSGIFHASAVRLAEHFGVSQWTVIRAMEALKLAGFFVVISKELFQSTSYRVVSHKDWVVSHPENCAVKAMFPWSDEPGDELGKALYNASGGRAKWHANQLTALRKTGLSDDQIVIRFKLYVSQEIEQRQAGGWHGRWKFVPRQFVKCLKDEFFPPEIPEWARGRR